MNSVAEEIPSVSVPSIFAPRETIETQLPMKVIRADLERFASLVAETFMTYALVGHASPSPWSALEAQMKVIAGEYKEVSDAVELRDVKELRDGVGDLLYTVFGMAYRAGIPMTQDFDQVVRSNLTKFDLNPEEAVKTMQKYADLGVVTYCQPVRFSSDERHPAVYYVTFVDGDQVGTDGKTYPNHKWLKSTRFVDICLQPMAHSHPLNVTSTSAITKSFQDAFEILDSQTNPNLYRALISTLTGIYLIAIASDVTDANMVDIMLFVNTALLSLFWHYGDAPKVIKRDYVAAALKNDYIERYGLPDAVERQYLAATLRHLTQVHAGMTMERFLNLMEANIQVECPTFLEQLRICGRAIDDCVDFRTTLSESFFLYFNQEGSPTSYDDRHRLFTETSLHFLTGATW